MIKPFISCIMPTANRKDFLSKAIGNFLMQDYYNSELIIIDDGIDDFSYLIPDSKRVHYYYFDALGTIGIKRNEACRRAKGDFIIHLDDDDLYAFDWLTTIINALLKSSADIVGLNSIYYFSLNLQQHFKFENKDSDLQWICGATMAYKKSLWINYNFSNLQIGEDNDFFTNSGGTVFSFDYTDGYVAIIHKDNTSIKSVSNSNTMNWQNLNIPKD